MEQGSGGRAPQGGGQAAEHSTEDSGRMTAGARGARGAGERGARQRPGAGSAADWRDLEEREYRPRPPADEYADDEPVRRPRGRPFSRSLDLARDVDWARAGTFGSGIAIGALVGAGLALLLAPQSGVEMRRSISRAGQRAGTRAADAWGGLGDDWRVASARARRGVHRGARRGRRSANDAADALLDLDLRQLRRGWREWRD